MSATIDTTDVVPEIPFGLGTELRIRIGEAVEEMRSRFDQFIQQNPDLVVEQDASGEIVIRSPAGAEGSARNSDITVDLGVWTRKFGGVSLDSSGMFILPNGAKRSPEATWISAQRWEGFLKKRPPEISSYCARLCARIAIRN